VSEQRGGPAVWLDLDQQALDDAYDQSKYALNRSQTLERYASNSDIARERLGAPRAASGARARRSGSSGARRW